MFQFSGYDLLPVVEPTNRLGDDSSRHQFVDDLYYLVKRVNDILKHYGYSPTNFSRNYIENSELFYNKTLQKELGLR